MEDMLLENKIDVIHIVSSTVLRGWYGMLYGMQLRNLHASKRADSYPGSPRFFGLSYTMALIFHLSVRPCSIVILFG
jgi:hypothetical protein